MRDDIDILPLPAKAKAYARRKGLASMMRQPDDFVAVNAEITNPGKPNKFKNNDVVGKTHKTWERQDMDQKQQQHEIRERVKAKIVQEKGHKLRVRRAAGALVERLLAKAFAPS